MEDIDIHRWADFYYSVLRGGPYKWQKMTQWPMISKPLTISQVNKAGRILRQWAKTKDDSLPMLNAYTTMLQFRIAHQRPLTRATVSLRWRVEREGCRVEVSQRLFKSGQGPQPIRDWLEVVSKAMALEESGEEVDTVLMERIVHLRTGALTYME